MILPKQLRNRFAAVGDGDGAGAVEQLFAGVDPHRGVNGGVEIGDGYRVFDDLFAQLVGDAPGSAMFEPASGQDHAETTALMSASTTTVEGSGATEFGADDYQRFVEHLLVFQIGDQGRQGDVEFFDEKMLVQLTFVVSVPSGAVDKIEVVGNFDETHPALHQSPGEQTTLSELASVGVAQVIGFVVSTENAA